MIVVTSATMKMKLERLQKTDDLGKQLQTEISSISTKMQLWNKKQTRVLLLLLLLFLFCFVFVCLVVFGCFVFLTRKQK